MSALDPRKPLVRFEDRTRWAPMRFISETDSRPVSYLTLPESLQPTVRIVTSAIYRMLTQKDPL